MRADERDLEPELAEFESRLLGFRPGPTRLDRDRMMYLAGRAAVESERRRGSAGGWGQRVWPAAFGAMTVVAASLLVALVAQQQADPIRPSTDGRGTLATTASGRPSPEPQPERRPLAPRLTAPQREARVSRNDSSPPSALPVGSRLNDAARPIRAPVNDAAQLAEQASAPVARPFRFRRSDDWEQMLDRPIAGPIPEPPGRGHDEPLSGSTAQLPAQLDEFQRLTCFEYRRVLLQESTGSPPNSAPTSTLKSSGA